MSEEPKKSPARKARVFTLLAAFAGGLLFIVGLIADSTSLINLMVKNDIPVPSFLLWLSDSKASGKESGTTIRLNKSSYKIGDTLEATIIPAQDGHLRLIHQSVDGGETVLFPNPSQPDDRVSAGQPVQVPHPSGTEILRISEPAGPERLVALLSAEPFRTNLLLPSRGQPLLQIKSPSTKGWRAIELDDAELSENYSMTVRSFRVDPAR